MASLSEIYKAPQGGSIIFSQQKEKYSANQKAFENAIQSWELNQILAILQKGQIDPHAFIIPNKELAEKLMVLDQELHIIRESGEEYAIEDFTDDCAMPAWMLISLFTEGDKHEGLRIEILNKFSDIIDDDFEKRFENLFQQVAKFNDFEDSDVIKDFFHAIYQYQIQRWKSDYNFNFEVDFRDEACPQPPECPCYLED